MPDSPFFRHVRHVPAGIATAAARESWTIEAERCRMAVESALPDASVELYFNLGPCGRHMRGSAPGAALPHRAAWVVGPRDQPLLIAKETRDCDIVAIRLHPWMAGCVLGTPASELRGTMVDLDEFWGAGVEAVRDDLHRTSAPGARLAVVERAVYERARHGMTEHARVAQLLCHATECETHGTVTALAAAYGLTHRRVIEVFDRAVGLKPKAYQRVRRLRRVFQFVHETPRQTWTAIAHRCGYYDQAHLISDFRLLTGISPSQYESTRSSVGHGSVPHTLAR
jgi:AraC-like DNA-binding protein